MNAAKIAGVVICGIGFSIVGYFAGWQDVIGLALAMWGYELQQRGTL